MKLTVDWDACEGHGLCTSEAPHVFVLDDNDDLQLLKDPLEESDREPVEAAVRVCPKRALTLSD